ncbi:MAG: transposase, partial [Deltaproteobacteria bacterium]|nr:transposase [Deltaproteobacteria bacterium]
FSMVKPSESAKTLASVSADLFALIEQFKDHPEIKAMHSYKLLERILKEQCNVNVSDDKYPVKVKKPKEIPSDSLQNPSDPDATYSGHKGQGYQVQVMENANALIPAIESSKERGLAPEEVLADALYGSDKNCQDAAKLGVEVISPAMGSKEEGSISLSDFEVSEKGDVVSCPQGHKPVMRKAKKTRHTVAFDSRYCSNCPLQEICLVRQGKKYHYLRYTDKEMRLSKRRAYEQTEEFKDRYRWRAGSEATMSEYDRRTGVKHLRVRGFKAVRFCATLKAIGVNIFRATAVRRAVNDDKAAHGGVLSARMHAVSVVKEHFLMAWSQVRKFFIPFHHSYEHMPIMTA